MSTSLLFFSSLISERQNRPRSYNLYFTLSKVMSFFPVQLYAFSLLSVFSIRQIFLLALDISIFFSFSLRSLLLRILMIRIFSMCILFTII
jgi:hypothetical protein